MNSFVNDPNPEPSIGEAPSPQPEAPGLPCRSPGLTGCSALCTRCCACARAVWHECHTDAGALPLRP